MLVIVEQNYKITGWCREIVEGLRTEARKKRINLAIGSSIEEIASSEHPEGAVMIVGSDMDWLCSAVCTAKGAGKHPIVLSNQSERSLGGGVSCVTEDLFESMGAICRHFDSVGARRVALYAVNPKSASDTCRMQAFLEHGGNKEDIFTNSGSLSDCFEHFLAKHRQNQYNALVCTNDFAALSLLRHMKDSGQTANALEIISYSNTLLSECSTPAVSTVVTNYESFGKLAFMILDCIIKSDTINGMHVLAKWTIRHRDTSSSRTSLPSVPSTTLTEEAAAQFYHDPELIEMMRIEKLLSECDEVDLDILKMILEGKLTAEIELCCYLTPTALKYRMKKMKDTCAVSSRAELCEVLCKYLGRGDSLFLLKHRK
ncbi:MAG: LacI family DNA-binding transcriptional regulator [Clostridia bacterium]|nr:LacI family DNA-binding transcriptional regulator [Clostridia bacterium]